MEGDIMGGNSIKFFDEEHRIHRERSRQFRRRRKEAQGKATQLVCVECGEPFVPKRFIYTNRQKFCSEKCKETAGRRRPQRRMYVQHWNEANKELMAEYCRKFKRTKYLGYGGQVICPKCGEQGSKLYQTTINVKTGVEYKPRTIVIHYYFDGVKSRYRSSCYIGMGKI